MKATKEPTPEVQTPELDAPELEAATRLGEALRAWNIGTPTRSKLTPEHEKALDGLGEVAAALLAAMPHSRTSDTEERETIRNLAKQTKAYIALTRDTKPETIAVGVVGETSVIQSEAARSHIAHLGDELIESINEFIGERTATLERHAGERQAIGEALAKVRELPDIGPLVAVYESLTPVIAASGPESNIADGAAHFLLQAIDALLSLGRNAETLGTVSASDVRDLLLSRTREEVFAADARRIAEAEARVEQAAATKAARPPRVEDAPTARTARTRTPSFLDDDLM